MFSKFSTNRFKLKIIYIAIIVFILFPATSFASKLYLEPNGKEYHQGNVFIQEIRLNTQGEYINTAEINLSFPKDILEVKDISKGNSILTLWAKEPIFSNEKGEISFIGGIPAGYQGWDGLLIKIIFQVSEKTLISDSKVIQLTFLDSSQVLLNDGLGTNDNLELEKHILTILPREPEVSKDEWQIELKKDVISPEPFSIEVYKDASIFNGKYFIIFSAVDKQTGIDFYEVKEGNRDWVKTNSPYLLEDQELGSIINVKAIDKAGNERVVSLKALKEIQKEFPYWIIILVLMLIVWSIIKKFKVQR